MSFDYQLKYYDSLDVKPVSWLKWGEECDYTSEIGYEIVFPKEKREEYILANLAQNERKECWSITIILGDEDNAIDIQYHLFNQNDIPESRILNRSDPSHSFWIPIPSFIVEQSLGSCHLF